MSNCIHVEEGAMRWNGLVRCRDFFALWDKDNAFTAALL